jgi:hypothetical protein
MLRPSDSLGGNEIRVLQHPEVVHHAVAGHCRQMGTQLSECLAILVEESVEQRSPTSIVERTKDIVEIVHVFNAVHPVDCR